MIDIRNMTNEQYLKSLTGFELMQKIKKISDVPFHEYVDWVQWLASPLTDPEFNTLNLPFTGRRGRVHMPDGSILSCLVLDTHMMYGTMVAHVLTQFGQHITVPPEMVEVLAELPENNDN